jgi:leucyl aminopeptidase (aminopeptidase T)
VTSESGTDLEFEVGDRPVETGRDRVSEPGELCWFPGAMGSVMQIGDGMNGTMAVDGSVFPFGVPDQPVLLEIEKGLIKEIRGGNFAKRWAKWMESHNDPLVYQSDHFSVGFNPRAEMTGWTTEDERVIGAITAGFGGTRMGGQIHVDVILEPPTIVAGDKTLLKDRLLNDELGFVNM